MSGASGGVRIRICQGGGGGKRRFGRGSSNVLALTSWMDGFFGGEDKEGVSVQVTVNINAAMFEHYAGVLRALNSY